MEQVMAQTQEPKIQEDRYTAKQLRAALRGKDVFHYRNGIKCVMGLKKSRIRVAKKRIPLSKLSPIQIYRKMYYMSRKIERLSK